MSNDKTYNGWTNYETWNVALWLGNDEGSYNFWRDRAQEAVERNVDADREVDREVDREAAIRELAEMLKEDIADNNPLADQASLYSDILSANLSEVDWYEIAQHWVDEAAESIAA